MRSPWAVALLPIITLGIYHFVWWYKINKELKAYGEAKGYDLGQNPTNSLLALSPASSSSSRRWSPTGAAPSASREPRNSAEGAGQRLDRAAALPLHRPRHVGLPAGLAEPLWEQEPSTARARGAAGLRRDAAAPARRPVGTGFTRSVEGPATRGALRSGPKALWVNPTTLPSGSRN